MHLTLYRLRSPGSETFGRLRVGAAVFTTREGDVDLSIPAGNYDLLAYLSETHGLVYRLDSPDLRVIAFGRVPSDCRGSIELRQAARGEAPTGSILLTGEGGGTQDSETAMIRLRRLLGTADAHTLAIEAPR